MSSRATAYQAVVNGPDFSLGVRCGEDAVEGIEFLTPRPVEAPRNPLAAEAARQLQAYLADPAFVFGLPLRPAGTAFQRRIWAGIAAIASGQTRSYGQLARDLDSAPRAVGQACGANPYPLAVPCHRVIAAQGGLGGFNRQGGGFLLQVKGWLLRHEGSFPSPSCSAARR